MIVFDGLELLMLLPLVAILIICCVVSVIEHIVCAVKRHQQKRIDAAFKQEDQDA